MYQTITIHSVSAEDFAEQLTKYRNERLIFISVYSELREKKERFTDCIFYT